MRKKRDPEYRHNKQTNKQTIPDSHFSGSLKDLLTQGTVREDRTERKRKAFLTCLFTEKNGLPMYTEEHKYFRVS